MTSQALLALLIATSCNTTDLKKSTQMIPFQESMADKKEMQKIKDEHAQALHMFMHLDQCKLGYIQHIKEEKTGVRLIPKRKFFSLRRCHQDVKFNGNHAKPFSKKNKLCSSGR